MVDLAAPFGAAFFVSHTGKHMQQPLMATYGRLPVRFERGAGPWLWDDRGRRYLDALSGIAVCGLGHAHPAVTRAIHEQSGKLLHTSNLYDIPLQQELAADLCSHGDMESAFFCNSGAEANEAAIKLARFLGHERGFASPKIVVMESAFHGRTMATLTATGNRQAQRGFEPMLEGFLRIPFDDLAALDQLAREHEDIIAVLVEPIQGEGGVRLPGSGYLAGLRARCDARGWLLMLDEVQCGMGRTGKWFAFQHTDILPDVITLAKGLGNGVPIGACLARGPAAGTLQPGSHGSTFGGNPLASAAGIAVVSTIATEGLAGRAALLGHRLLEGLQQALGEHPGVREIRGQGLMIGIELEEPCGDLVARALETGLLVNVTAGSVVRLLPPLILTDAEAGELLERVIRLLRDHLAAST